MRIASFNINGTGAVNLISFSSGSVNVTEAVPTGWQLDSASCVLSNGTSTGTKSGSSMNGVLIEQGRETTCTFTDSKRRAKLTLVKVVVNDNGGNATKNDWTCSASGPTPPSASA